MICVSSDSCLTCIMCYVLSRNKFQILIKCIFFQSQSDSGSLIQNIINSENMNRSVIIGIYSSKSQSDYGSGILYFVRVSYYIDWILKTISSNEEIEKEESVPIIAIIILIIVIVI